MNNSSSNNNDQNDEARPWQDRIWTHAKDFVDTDTGMCIRVNYSDTKSKHEGGIPMRMFSWELVRTRASSEKVSRYFPIMMQERNGKVVLENVNLAVLNGLIADAESWAKSERQERTNKILKMRVEREQTEKKV